jgi:hypothetical protein
MRVELITIITHGLIIILALFSVIYTFGVVWRVEKKLDVSYKFFLAAIIFFTLSEIIQLFILADRLWLNYLASGLRFLFVIFFLLGTLEMRELLRRLDGEKPQENKTEEI